MPQPSEIETSARATRSDRARRMKWITALACVFVAPSAWVPEIVGPGVARADAWHGKKSPPPAEEVCEPIPLPATDISAFAVDPYRPHTLFLAANREFYVSHNNGRRWTLVPTPWGDAREWDIEFDPNVRGLMYVAVDNALYRGFDRVLDLRLVVELERTNTDRITIAPSDSRVIYVWALHTFFEGGQTFTLPFIYKSSDFGATWSALDIQNVAQLAVSPEDADVVYVVDIYGVVSKSVDGGATFETLDTGFPARSETRHAILVDPYDGDVVYVSLIDTGVLRSIDGGSSWEKVSDFNGRLLAIDPREPTDLYAAQILSDSTVLSRSRDGGRTWTTLPVTGFPTQVEFDLRDASAFYAVFNNSVYRCDQRPKRCAAPHLERW